MQQTEKYKFNLIETSDTFGPEKLNENAQKLEDALTTHESTVSAALAQHKSEVTAALTQHKSETTTALGTKADKTTLDALTKTVTANKTAADTTIAAVEKGANLVHLAGPQTRSSGAAFNINLSGIDITKYRALLVFVRHISSFVFSACGMSLNLIGPGAAMIWIYQADTTVAIAAKVSYSSGTTYGLQSDGKHSTTSWSSLKNITCDGNAYFIDVYGIKA